MAKRTKSGALVPTPLADYGGLVAGISDLLASHGRGFSERNLRQMRAFFLGWEIRQTVSAEFAARVKGTPFDVPADQPKAGSLVPVARPASPILVAAFPLPWSHYVRLLSVEDPFARAQRPSTAEIVCVDRPRRGGGAAPRGGSTAWPV